MRIFTSGGRKIIQPHLGGQPRLFPNLNPSAALPVDRDQIFHLQSFFENYRMHRGKERAQYVPNAKYVFVKMASGETLMHPRFRHPALAEGHPVLYAGEAKFDNGKLLWWSNASGNYRPDAAHAAQAGFPMDQFLTYEQVIKGVSPEAARSETQQGATLPGQQRTVIARGLSSLTKPSTSPGAFATEGRFTAR